MVDKENLMGMSSFEREIRVRNLLEQVRDEYFPELRGRKFYVKEVNTHTLFLGVSNSGRGIEFSRPIAYYPENALKGDLAHELSHVVLGHPNAFGISKRSEFEKAANEETERRGLAENLKISEDLFRTMKKERLITEKFYIITNENELIRYLCDLAEQEEK